jgi:hypothetical protein
MGAKKRRCGVSLVESDCWFLDRFMSGLRGRDFVESEDHENDTTPASPDESQTRVVSRELTDEADLDRVLRDIDVAVSAPQPLRPRKARRG